MTGFTFLDLASVKGKSKKRCPTWRGPAQVIKCLSSYLYRVRFRKVLMVLNHDRLKLCQDRVLPTVGGSQLNEEAIRLIAFVGSRMMVALGSSATGAWNGIMGPVSISCQQTWWL